MIRPTVEILDGLAKDSRVNRLLLTNTLLFGRYIDSNDKDALCSGQEGVSLRPAGSPETKVREFGLRNRRIRDVLAM
jgi:hypothetical protein